MWARACCEARRTSGLCAPSAKPLRGTALALPASRACLRLRPRLAAPHALRIRLAAEAFPFGVSVPAPPEELASSLALVLSVVLKMY